MKLCVCAFAATSSAIWGVGFLIVGLLNRFFPPYGIWFLEVVESVYPGYHAGWGLKNLAIGFLWALLDGFVAGGLLAWVYNRISRKCCGS
jgi:hypothetical protein